MKTLMRHRAVSWEDPMVGAALALDTSGLDYLRAIAGGRIAAPLGNGDGGNGNGR